MLLRLGASPQPTSAAEPSPLHAALTHGSLGAAHALAGNGALARESELEDPLFVEGARAYIAGQREGGVAEGKLIDPMAAALPDAWAPGDPMP